MTRPVIMRVVLPFLIVLTILYSVMMKVSLIMSCFCLHLIIVLILVRYIVIIFLKFRSMVVIIIRILLFIIHLQRLFLLRINRIHIAGRKLELIVSVLCVEKLRTLRLYLLIWLIKMVRFFFSTPPCRCTGGGRQWGNNRGG